MANRAVVTEYEIENLKKLAEMATKGKYTVRVEISREDYDGEYPSGVGYIPEILTVETSDGDCMSLDDAFYIAALHNSYQKLIATYESARLDLSVRVDATDRDALIHALIDKHRASPTRLGGEFVTLTFPTDTGNA